MEWLSHPESSPNQPKQDFTLAIIIGSSIGSGIIIFAGIFVVFKIIRCRKHLKRLSEIPNEQKSNPISIVANASHSVSFSYI